MMVASAGFIDSADLDEAGLLGGTSVIGNGLCILDRSSCLGFDSRSSSVVASNMPAIARGLRRLPEVEGDAGELKTGDSVSAGE
jgi:hypothetical protein